MYNYIGKDTNLIKILAKKYNTNNLDNYITSYAYSYTGR